MNYEFKRDSITQLARDQQAHRLRELRASNDPRAKLAQSAYVKAQKEARAILQGYINGVFFSEGYGAEYGLASLVRGKATQLEGVCGVEVSEIPGKTTNQK